MANGDTRLPEGTDSIIDGTSVTTDLSSTGGLSSTSPGYDNSMSSPAPAATAREALADAKDAIDGKTTALRDQAASKAREYALMGKERAVDGLQNIQKMIEDAAVTVDDKVGSQFGDYIRQAGTSVASLSEMIEGKDVDDLVTDARTLVRNSPGIAIGAATAIGFLLARVAKAGFEPTPPTTATPTTPTTPGTRPVA